MSSKFEDRFSRGVCRTLFAALTAIGLSVYTPWNVMASPAAPNITNLTAGAVACGGTYFKGTMPAVRLGAYLHTAPGIILAVSQDGQGFDPGKVVVKLSGKHLNPELRSKLETPLSDPEFLARNEPGAYFELPPWSVNYHILLSIWAFTPSGDTDVTFKLGTANGPFTQIAVGQPSEDTCTLQGNAPR